MEPKPPGARAVRAGASAGSDGQSGRPERAPTPLHFAHPRNEGVAAGGGE